MEGGRGISRSFPESTTENYDIAKSVQGVPVSCRELNIGPHRNEVPVC